MIELLNENSDIIIDKYLKEGIKFDCIITDPVYDQQPDIDRLLSVCKGNVLVFCAPEKRPSKQPDEVLFWVKPQSTKNTVKNCSRFVEEIMVYRQGNIFNPQYWSIMTGVFTDTIMSKSFHQWQKPISLIEKLVLIYSNVNDIVFDPYAGSGTTGIACKRHKRNFLGCEMDKEVFNKAIEWMNDQ